MVPIHLPTNHCMLATPHLESSGSLACFWSPGGTLGNCSFMDFCCKNNAGHNEAANNFFSIPVSSGDQPLTKKPEDSGYEIGAACEWMLKLLSFSRLMLVHQRHPYDNTEGKSSNMLSFLYHHSINSFCIYPFLVHTVSLSTPLSLKILPCTNALFKT